LTKALHTLAAPEAMAETHPTPLENNAEAADDVKKMLAELKGGAESTDHDKTNGATTTANGTSEPKPENGVDREDGKDNDDRHPDRRHQKDEDEDEPRYRGDRDGDDRNGRGHRGGRGGRGGGRGDFKPRNKRDNIKSNLVQEEESDDPVAIRKQVLRICAIAILLF
jgi:hypothetical protein